MKEYYTVQLVKHVNYTAYVEANSQEEAEQKAAEDTSKYDWVKWTDFTQQKFAIMTETIQKVSALNSAQREIRHVTEAMKELTCPTI